MAADIITEVDAFASFTITLASLANGSARQATIVDNTLLKRPAANIAYLIKSGGTGPTAGAIYEIFLERREDTTTAAGNTCVADDAAGIADAAITIENSQLIGALVVTNTANKNFYAIFTTANLGVLGPAWLTSVRNSSGQALNATEGDHRKRYQTYRPRSTP
jgi:hypothetical protein